MGNLGKMGIWDKWALEHVGIGPNEHSGKWALWGKWAFGTDEHWGIEGKCWALGINGHQDK